MIKINTETCIGCKKCLKDCYLKDIVLLDGKASPNNTNCIKCGHCIAICPVNAVSTDEYNMDEVISYDKESFTINSDHLMNFIKFRRSIRQFKKLPVEDSKIHKIIESGRFTQTGGNYQNVSYIVVKNQLKELKDLTFETLNTIGKNMLAHLKEDDTQMRMLAKDYYIGLSEFYKENPLENDRLFNNAPLVIIVAADQEVDAALASSNMELMTNTLGLGTMFSGFFAMAAAESQEIQAFLNLKEGMKIVICMVIGYPDVQYVRTVPRKKALVDWK
jgi:nitroreductase/NAD-dependent dihydropyrimidine dehydrogenase PreA subunit